MQKTPRKTLILSPLSRAGMRHDENARFIYSELPQAFAEAGSECQVVPLVGLDQAQARAEMLSVFKHHESYEDALFVDGDVTTHPSFALTLSQLESDLLCCAYEDRLPDAGMGDDGGTGAFMLDTAGFSKLQMREGMKMLPVRGLGLGLTRIRRSVVDRLWAWIDANRDHELVAKNPIWTSHFPGLMGLKVAGLFEPVRHEHPAGSGVIRRRPEDMSFFAICHAAGIQAYCPVDIPVMHAGRGGRSLYDAMIEEERLKSARRRHVDHELAVCPDALVKGCAHVLDGAYDVPGLEIEPGEVILDLGANIGSFAVWALGRFPYCKLHCYEPLPDLIPMLEKNVARAAAGDRQVTIHQVAVTGSEATRTLLYRGVHNDGMASVTPTAGEHEPEGFEVVAISARKLPAASIIKCDIESAEVEVAILEKYPHWEGVKAVLLEWHSQGSYLAIYEMMRARGFRAYVDRTRGRPGADRELCFVRPEAFKAAEAKRSNGHAAAVSEVCA